MLVNIDKLTDDIMIDIALTLSDFFDLQDGCEINDVIFEGKEVYQVKIKLYKTRD